MQQFHKLNATNERVLYDMAEMNDLPGPQNVVNGPFPQDSGETSWWNAFSPIGGTNWSVVETGDTATKSGDWFPIGAVRTAPDQVTDLMVTLDAGNHYRLQRRCRAFYWLDWRLMVNGTVRFTRSSRWYWYEDERTDTNPDVVEAFQYSLQPMGCKSESVTNIPAGAQMQVEARQRYRVVSSQASAYFRIIGGLRSQANFQNYPRAVVVGRS